MMKITERAFKITKEQTDSNGNLQLGSLAQILELTAAAHQKNIGTNESVLWMIVRREIKLCRLPKAGNVIRVQTWNSGQKFGLFQKNFDLGFYGERKSRFGEASCLWAPVDITTRKIAVLPETVPQPTQNLPKEAVRKTPAMQVNFPPTLEKHACHSVRMDEIDHNRHVNNAHYLRWAEACAAKEFCSDAEISRSLMPQKIWVAYDREILPREIVTLHYQRCGNLFFLKGFVENENAFSVKIDYI